MAGTSHEIYTADGRDQISMVEDLQAAYADLQRQQLEGLAQVEDAQRDANQELSKGSKESDGLFSSAKKLKGQLAAVAAAAAIVGSTIAFVGAETARLDTIQEQAVKSGLGLAAYQRLDHVASMAGTSVDDLSKATTKLTLGLREIDKGAGGKVASALGDIGLAASDLRGQESTEQLAMIADGLAGVSSESERAAIAVEIFGKQGRELLPMLAEGGDSLRKMEQSVGYIFTAEDLDKAAAYQDAIAELNKSAKDASGTLAIALAPMMTEIAEGFNDAAKDVGRYQPAITAAVDAIGRGLKPVIGYVMFFVKAWEIAGNTISVADRYWTQASEGVGELASSFSDWFDSTWAGSAVDWITDTGSSLGEMADSGVDRLTSAIKEHVPFAEDLADVWHDVTTGIMGANAAASSLSLIAKGQQAITGWIESGAEAAEAKAETEAKQLTTLERASAEAEHQVALAEAQGRPNSELERLYANQHAARLELLLTTKDLAGLEAEMRDEEVRAASARSSRRSGSSGPTDAERMEASGEIILDQWRDRLTLTELAAEANGEEINTARIHYEIKRQELELERQVLEATKAKGEIERQQNEARIEQIGRELTMVDYEEAVAARERQQELIAQAAAEAQALADAEADAHAARLAQIAAENEAREKANELARRLAEEEKARKAAAWKQTATISNDVTSLSKSAGALSSFIVDQTVKDEDRRAKIKLRTEGMIATAVGVGEIVQAAAAYASLNIPQGIAHTAAGVLGIAQGALMMAGQLPSGSASSATSAIPAQQPAKDRETSEGARTVDSVPNAADQGPRRVGGKRASTGGGVVLLIEGDVNGSVDEAFAEQVAIAIAKSGYASEAAA